MSGERGAEPGAGEGPRSTPKPTGGGLDWQYAAGAALVIVALIVAASLYRDRHTRPCLECAEKAAQDGAEPSLALADDHPPVIAPVDPDRLIEAELSESRL